jgi:fatty acyl-CoA reductase
MNQYLNAMNTETSQIKNFYRGKTVLVTGTTGFVGKVLLEKLIRTFTDVKCIYLMIRPRPNISPKQRMYAEIFST